jgi:hypothetical protein
MWKDTIHDTLFIGQTVDDLNEEIKGNTQSISLNIEERAITSRQELVHFFYNVMNNRKDQIRRAGVKRGMWFYVWHDQQASQLRFSLISAFHQKLPFGAETRPETLETIIDEFLYDDDHFLFSDLEIRDYVPEEQRPEDDTSTFVLPVFKIQLL